MGTATWHWIRSAIKLTAEIVASAHPPRRVEDDAGLLAGPLPASIWVGTDLPSEPPPGHSFAHATPSQLRHQPAGAGLVQANFRARAPEAQRHIDSRILAAEKSAR